MSFAICLILGHLLGSKLQIIQKILRYIVNHVVHLGVEGVWPEHIPILFRDFFDSLQGHDYVRNIARDEVRVQLGNQAGPLSLNVSFTHKRNTLEQLSLDLPLRTTHSHTNQILL